MKSESEQSPIKAGYDLLRQGLFREAVEHGERLASRAPRDVDVLVFLSEACFAVGDLEMARSRLQSAIEASGGSLPLKIKQAGLLVHMRRRADARALAMETTTSAGARGNGQALWQLASIMVNCNRPAEAIGLYEQARVSLGDHPGLLYDLAVAQFFTGDFAGAELNLDRMLGMVPDAGHALYLRSTVRRQTDARNHVDALRQRLASGVGRAEWEAGAWYALGKELEDLGEHDAAFDAIVRGAAVKRSTLTYDIAAECAAIVSVCDAYSETAMNEAAAGHEAADPIFVVGMPRTGTTLLERILVQGGDVRSAGEPLDFAQLVAQYTRQAAGGRPEVSPAEASRGIDFEALGREYARGASEAAGATRFIDKMPVNYLYCGLIRKALPNARILHLTRDPVDSCWAIFKTLFFSAYHFSYDLEELGRYYVAYAQAMAHWHSVMPNGILDVRYEDLVSDPEGEAKRVLEWCRLPYDASIRYGAAPQKAAFTTASAAQVREPVHARSVGSSRRHRERLAPLIETFAAAGLQAR
ncbi:tetratricopeptide repeat-containing sulfotransferase family protein [Luteimonas deserti]|uniref:Sulfotransferase n=1 Tax=Luteimonas deserti TaxID=2752306 RepID=A0A7Z0TV69_9GAMM|nr:sulfotransferase [Luteimonas deserti]NYZ63561.1 sulfotransferase [Luteimonas deserti]